MTKRIRTAAATVSAVIYLRVSTERQAETGLGREAQEARCRAYAEGHGWTVASVHVDDGLSGTLPVAKRAGLAAALEAVAAAPGSVLLVHSLSRFARSQKELWSMLDGRDPVPLVSATEPFDLTTAMGRAFVGMLGVIAALETDLASERTTAALGAARARGTRLGAPTMVESTDEHGVRFVDPAKVALVRHVQDLAAEGLSLRTIAARLTAEGHPTTSGRGGWHPKTIRTALAVEVGT